MSRKIVIEPYFNEGHLIKHHIENLCDYLKPDIYVISEGMFSFGPEGLHKDIKIKNSIITKYTLDGQGKRSFDFPKLKQVVADCQKKYPHIEFHILEMDYGKLDTQRCFEQAYNGFKKVTEPRPDDIIFPSECDVFVTKAQGEIVLKLAKMLQPNKAFCCSYRLFFESPRVYWKGDKRDSRRIAYRYGTGFLWGNYDGVPGTDCMYWEDPVYYLGLFHYKWVRPGKYWEFRKNQILRHKAHHIRIEKAKIMIQNNRHNLDVVKHELKHVFRGRFRLNSLTAEDHPKHFRNHESFKYYYE